jgi:hypothetical protein
MLAPGVGSGLFDSEAVPGVERLASFPPMQTRS